MYKVISHVWSNHGSRPYTYVEASYILLEQDVRRKGAGKRLPRPRLEGAEGVEYKMSIRTSKYAFQIIPLVLVPGYIFPNCNFDILQTRQFFAAL